MKSKVSEFVVNTDNEKEVLLVDVMNPLIVFTVNYEFNDITPEEAEDIGKCFIKAGQLLRKYKKVKKE